MIFDAMLSAWLILGRGCSVFWIKIIRLLIL
jgi:hypothetical protein